jgi:serine/threonine-protein kinase HipA
MNRMIKVLRSQLPKLLAIPDYTPVEQATLQDISMLMLKQAAQLESDAKMITKVELR